MHCPSRAIAWRCANEITFEICNTVHPGDGCTVRFWQYGSKCCWRNISLGHYQLTFPGGVPTVNTGGSDYALAADLTTIQISGHGTFGGGVAPTGGGTWATSGPSGTASGTFSVIGFIRFTVAPGSLPPGFIDNIGDPANTRSGLAVLLIKYSDGSSGVLTVSCHQPVGSPSGIFEGITATKGFVAFHERVPPVPGVDANRTLFHVAP